MSRQRTDGPAKRSHVVIRNSTEICPPSDNASFTMTTKALIASARRGRLSSRIIPLLLTRAHWEGWL